MHALISTLTESDKARVIGLWERLANACELRGIYQIPLPHFSWHGAEAYDLQALVPRLEEWAKRVEPFEVHTSGLGIFTGPNPILYLRLVATQQLEDYHRHIWQQIQATAPTGPSTYYAPPAWMPHITLGIEDVSIANIGCAVSQLAFEPYNWHLQIDNLTLVSHDPEQPGQIIRQIRLGS